MSKILKKLEDMAGTNCSAIISHKRLIASTFEKHEVAILNLAQQAFTHILKHADKADALKTTIDETVQQYDEVHLQLGQNRLICFRLKENILYISKLEQSGDIHKAQKVIRGALGVLKKVANATTTPEQR
jgi:hypothetical protein